MWTWASISPGVTNQPARSITSAPAGTGISSPTWAMRPPSRTMTPFLRRCPVPVQTSAPTRYFLFVELKSSPPRLESHVFRSQNGLRPPAIRDHAQNPSLSAIIAYRFGAQSRDAGHGECAIMAWPRRFSLSPRPRSRTGEHISLSLCHTLCVTLFASHFLHHIFNSGGNE